MEKPGGVDPVSPSSMDACADADIMRLVVLKRKPERDLAVLRDMGQR
jgi:hypothetical protein